MSLHCLPLSSCACLLVVGVGCDATGNPMCSIDGEDPMVSPGSSKGALGTWPCQSGVQRSRPGLHRRTTLGHRERWRASRPGAAGVSTFGLVLLMKRRRPNSIPERTRLAEVQRRSRPSRGEHKSAQGAAVAEVWSSGWPDWAPKWPIRVKATWPGRGWRRAAARRPTRGKSDPRSRGGAGGPGKELVATWSSAAAGGGALPR